eukprot:SAG22_NODE_568_length_9030_cov_2.503527_2_plen_162_part_00
MPDRQEPRQGTCVRVIALPNFARLQCSAVLNRLCRDVQWVLNLNCSCNGGKKKLQPPVHASRVGESGAVVQFTCTHTHCKSFHGGDCPHFQMCPNWYVCITISRVTCVSMSPHARIHRMCVMDVCVHLCARALVLLTQHDSAFHQFAVQWRVPSRQGVPSE